jgi:hypothetical protein
MLNAAGPHLVSGHLPKMPTPPVPGMEDDMLNATGSHLSQATHA